MKCTIMIFIAFTMMGMTTFPKHTVPPKQPNLKRAQYEWLSDKYARRYGIPTLVMKRLIGIESGWDRYAISKKNALGLTQITPITARHFGVHWKSLDTPWLSIKTGARILANYIKQCGSLKMGLVAYNAGPGVCRYAETIMEVAE